MANTTPDSALLAVSAPPFWHCGRTIHTQNYNTLLALSPAMAMAIWHWGLPAARVMALAMLTGIVVEALCQKIMERDIAVDNFSAVLTSLLFSFLMPASAPWWLVVVGVTLCITLGKMAFGGLGANPVNSSLVGWALLYVSWPVQMDPNAMQLNTLFVDPLVQLKYFGVAVASQTPWLDLALGKQIGALGAAQTLALFVGGSYLAVRGMIRWEIAASFFVGVGATAAIFHSVDAQLYASPLFHLLTGSTILGGFFLATEPASSPDRQIPMMLYGVLGGVLVIIIRVYGEHTDGVPFAILLINLLTPLLDGIRPKPFGGK